VSSALTWLDVSAEQQRRVRDMIRLFEEPGTRDELGVGPVRDAFSELLFRNPLCVISEGAGVVKWGLAVGESELKARWLGPALVLVEGVRFGLVVPSPRVACWRPRQDPWGAGHLCAPSDGAWCVSASGQVDAIKRTTSPIWGVMTQPRSQPVRDLGGFMRLARGSGSCRRAARSR
jgi:hypothetical protein